MIDTLSAAAMYAAKQNRASISLEVWERGLAIIGFRSASSVTYVLLWEQIRDADTASDLIETIIDRTVAELVA